MMILIHYRGDEIQAPVMWRMVQLHVRALRALRALRAFTGLTGPYGRYGPFTGPIRALRDLRAPGNSPETDLT